MRKSEQAELEALLTSLERHTQSNATLLKNPTSRRQCMAHGIAEGQSVVLYAVLRYLQGSKTLLTNLYTF